MRPSEERGQFPSQGLTIEGLLKRRPGTRGRIVTHPHPLYGGDMDNNVVAVGHHSPAVAADGEAVGGADGESRAGEI